jgi:hypothetical protein
MTRYLLPLGAVAMLAACAPTEMMTFNSKQEEACYREVSAGLPADRQLRRDAAGRFVEVLIINDQVRDIDPSPEFNNCMVREAGVSTLSDMGTLNLTAEQQRVWSTLSDTQKREALEFVAEGGTFDQWLAQR